MQRPPADDAKQTMCKEHAHQGSVRRLACLGTALALGVTMLGAYVRLSDAGLACPDWPGCYGRLLVPAADAVLPSAYAEFPLERGKAWKEMAHRFAAGALGILILLLAVRAWRAGAGALLCGTLVLLICVQVILGMWTVTLLLRPLVVVLHLLGGMCILSLLWWLALRQGAALVSSRGLPAGSASLRHWIWTGLVILALQIGLGAWTSANYAALACPDFPACHAGQWWPADTGWAGAFALTEQQGTRWLSLGSERLMAVQMTHRLGALLTGLVLLVLAQRVWASKIPSLRGYVLLLPGLLLLQCVLGIANVLLELPLTSALLHNTTAAAMLLTLIALLHQTIPPPAERVSPVALAT